MALEHAEKIDMRPIGPLILTISSLSPLTLCVRLTLLTLLLFVQACEGCSSKFRGRTTATKENVEVTSSGPSSQGGDGTAGFISSLSAHERASTSNQITISIDFSASEPGISLVIFEGYPTCANPVGSEAKFDLSTESGATTIAYNTSRTPGTKTICSQIEHPDGQRSIILNDGHGEIGVDRIDFELLPSLSPRFRNLRVDNPTDGTLTIPLNQQGRIIFEAESAIGFATDIISDIEYSMDGTNWHPLSTEQISTAITASTSTTRSGTIVGWTSPTSTPFILRVGIKDANQRVTKKTTHLLNSPNWEIFAGSSRVHDSNSPFEIPLGVDDSNVGLQRILVSNATGEVFFIENGVGIMKLDRSTYQTKVVITNTDLDYLVSGLFLDQDSLGFIYIGKNDAIYRFDPREKTPSLSLYFQNGVDEKAGLAASEVKFWTLSPFTFDGNDNLYFVGGPSWAHGVGRRILKIRRAGAIAGEIEHIAGNGSHGALVSGSIAKNSPTPIYFLGITSIAANSDGSAIYISSQSGGPFKIVGNEVYTNIPIFDGPIIYDRSGPNGYFYNASYQAAGPFKIVRFKGVASSGVEEVENHVGAGVLSTGCIADVVAVTSSCPTAGRSINVDLYGRIYYIEGSSINSYGSLRIRTVFGSNVHTIAGFLGVGGVGLSRLSMNFVSPFRMRVGPDTNVYLGDGSGLQIVKIPQSLSPTEVVIGSGDRNHALVVNTPSAGQGLGSPYIGNAGNIDIDGTGRIYFRSGHYLHYIDNDPDRTVRRFGTALPARYWHATGNGGPFTGYLYPYLTNGGIEFDSANNLYTRDSYSSGGVPWFPQILRINRNDEILTYIAGKNAGTNSNVRSADGADAATSTIACTADGLWPALQACGVSSLLKVVGTTIYFSEVNRIRTIDKLDGTGKLGTVSDAASQPITDLHENTSHFFIDGDRIYYLAGNGLITNLYCRWKGSGAPPTNCTNTPLTPPVIVPRFLANQKGGLERLPDGSMLILASDMVVKYKP